MKTLYEIYVKFTDIIAPIRVGAHYTELDKYNAVCKRNRTRYGGYLSYFLTEEAAIIFYNEKIKPRNPDSTPIIKQVTFPY